MATRRKIIKGIWTWCPNEKCMQQQYHVKLEDGTWKCCNCETINPGAAARAAVRQFAENYLYENPE